MKRKEVILVAGGGHALSLAEFAGEDIIGYIANEANADMPGKWLGTDEDLPELIKSDHLFHIAFVYGGWPMMKKRLQLIELYEKAGAKFGSLIAPTAILTPNSSLGNGCAVMNGAIINRAKLGNHVVVNSGAIVEHDCTVGDNTFIGPGAVIGGFTSIGKNCFVGLGTKIGNGLKIGDNISIAMGAIVNRNLTEPGLYHGPGLKRFDI